MKKLKKTRNPSNQPGNIEGTKKSYSVFIKSVFS